MGVFNRLWSTRSPRRAGQPILSAEQLSGETGLPLLLEAPESALAAGEAGRPSPSLSRGQLETARSLIGCLESLNEGESPGSIFVSEGIEADDGVSPALAVATVSALDGRRTLLVELDFRRRPMSVGLQLDAAPGIGDYLNRAAHPQLLLQPLALDGRRRRQLGVHRRGRGQSRSDAAPDLGPISPLPREGDQGL